MSKRFTIQISDAEHQQIFDHAEKEGRTFSEFVRAAIYDRLYNNGKLNLVIEKIDEMKTSIYNSGAQK